MENATVARTTQGKWAGRFIWAAVIQGLFATIITVLILDPPQYFTGHGNYFSPAMVIAGGGGGTWFFTGYIAFLVVGVVATAVTAIFYFYIEGVKGKLYKGFSNVLAWGHLVFMNVGVAGAMFLMMWGGYMAGWAAAPVSNGGGGLNAGQIHVQYLGQLVDPIGGLVLLAAIGALMGGLGYIIQSRAK
jgi:phosphoglycerol transferase MdoB-like AlkP superfamily enzyme